MYTSNKSTCIHKILFQQYHNDNDYHDNEDDDENNDYWAISRTDVLSQKTAVSWSKYNVFALITKYTLIPTHKKRSIASLILY